MNHPLRILYCVLNWGLGHATRSIPVILALIENGFEVEIASDGGPLKLLRETFPNLKWHTLPGYNINYPSKFLFVNAITQFHKLLRAVPAEHKATRKILAGKHYDAIFSDNRYGCYSRAKPSVLVTHQLRDLAPNRILNFFLESSVRKYINNFTEVWVPDSPDRGLTGKNTDVNWEKVRFVGYLSDQRRAQSEIQYDIAAVLSGPEPQRSYLDKEIKPQLKAFEGKCVLARGIVEDIPVQEEGSLTIFPYLNREGVGRILNSSRVIVCRTGYTSLMDLLSVGTKAIVIPTPGQPEQEYLGEQLRDHPQFVVQKQGRIDIAGGFRMLSQRPAIEVGDRNQGLLQKAIQDLGRKVGFQ